MDLKILLRYQISGSIFIGWFLLFHYSVHSADFADMATKIMDISSLGALVLAIPIGAIIHQFSVTIKNQIFGAKFIPILSDSPMKLNGVTASILNALSDQENKRLEYIIERITNLNSFYYMRFDCGFLAPCFAIVLFCFIDNQCITFFAASIPLILIASLCLVCWLPWIGSLMLIAVLIIVPLTKYSSNINENKSNIQLTTKSIQIESNIRYVITNEYSLESSESMTGESVIITNGLKELKSISSILKSNNLQKTLIIESDISNQEESQLHISKAEITKINTELLNKILIACLIISFLLLSYIPRIIQELKEYTEELRPDIEDDKNNETSSCSDLCLLSGFILACIIWIIYSDRDK